MIGSFSNGGLGMGVAFVLEDYFSGTADTIERRMDGLEGNTDALASKINSAMDKIKLGFAGFLVGSAILSPFFANIEAASDLEENINKTAVAFKEYAADVDKFSKTSLDNFGIGRSQALEMASLYGDMGTSMGIPINRSADMSKSLVGLAGDLSSFKNISHDVAQNALKGIFTGETEALKGLGVVMTQDTLKRFAQEQGIQKTFKSMTQAEKVMLRYKFVMNATKNAQGDFARTLDGYANSKRVFLGAMSEFGAVLGNVVMPMMAKAFTWSSKLLKGLRAFGETPAGQAILKIVFAIGVFLTVGGLALMLMGGMRFALFKLAGAFGKVTAAKIIDIMATKGVVAGLYAMGTAAWASLGPYVLIIVALVAFAAVAKIAWDSITKGSKLMMAFGVILTVALGPIGYIIAGIALLVRGFTEFNAMGEDGSGAKKGVLGFLQKIAGTIKGVAAVWRSWNGETFELTEAMAKKLEALGILDFVLSLGTWAVRLKTLFMGIWEGIQEGFSVVKSVMLDVWTTVKGILSPIESIFDTLGWSIAKNTSDINKWKKVGKVVGYVIVGIFVAIAIAAAVAAINILIALAPILLIMAAIALAIWGVIWVVNHFGEIMTWVTTAIADSWEWVKEKVHGFFAFMFGLPAMMFGAGVEFVRSLWAGITSLWGNFTDWVTSKAQALADGVKGAFSWLADKTTKAIDFVQTPLRAVVSEVTGLDDEALRLNTYINNRESKDGLHHENTSKTAGAGFFDNFQNNLKTNTHLQVVLDGELISEKMLEKQELKDARK